MITQVITAAIFGNFTRIANNVEAERVQTAILDRLRAAPGVADAAVTSTVPLSAIQPGQQTIRLEGRVALEEVLKRFPEWEVDRERAKLAPTSTVRGWETLPVFTK